MDKFSKISGTKVNDLPKLIKSPEEMEVEQLKYGILKLMDNCLTIRAYGSARRNILEDTVKIAGKEMFIEALIDFMNDKSLKEQILVLESLKSKSKDWQSIDQKISEVSESIQNIRTLVVNGNSVKKIKMFLETYSEDDRFETLLENYVSKINDGEEAYKTSGLVKEMMKNTKFSIYPKQKLQQISKQYLIRATQLGFNPNGTNTDF
jgi:hypothetical protein